MVRYLITGASGQLGWELVRTLSGLGEVHGVDHGEFDLGDPQALRRMISELKPHVVINAAAHTAVDKAEEDSEEAMAINGVAPGVLAQEMARIGGAVIHYSTDYVFDGAKGSPYCEDDPVGPLNVYGRSKLAGERAVMEGGAPHLILRTSWIYGARGNNFFLTMRRLLRRRHPLRVVGDQVGTPNWSRMLAQATAAILTRLLAAGEDLPRSLEPHQGIYHVSGGGEVSWHGFTCAIAERLGLLDQVEIVAVPSREYPTAAARPAYAVLDSTKLAARFGIVLPHWSDTLDLVMAQAQDEDA